MADDTQKFHYEEENDQGDYSDERTPEYPSAFRFNNVDVKRDAKSLATDLANLYDCDVTTVLPTESDVLTWDSTPRDSDGKGRWVPREPGGGGCELSEGTMWIYVALSAVHYNELDNEIEDNGQMWRYDNPEMEHPHDGINIDTAYPLGSYLNPFPELQDVMDFLDESCLSITEEGRVNIIVMSHGIHRLCIFPRREIPNGDDAIDVVNCLSENYEDPMDDTWYDDNDNTTFNPACFDQYIGIDWKPVLINYQYAHRVFIYGLEGDEVNTIPDQDPDWHLRDTKSSYLSNPFVEFQYLFSLEEYYDDEDAFGDFFANFKDCVKAREMILSAFKPYITVSGTSLGGLYNIRFAKPIVDLNCQESETSSKSSYSGD